MNLSAISTAANALQAAHLDIYSALNRTADGLEAVADDAAITAAVGRVKNACVLLAARLAGGVADALAALTGTLARLSADLDAMAAPPANPATAQPTKAPVMTGRVKAREDIDAANTRGPRCAECGVIMPEAMPLTLCEACLPADATRGPALPWADAFPTPAGVKATIAAYNAHAADGEMMDEAFAPTPRPEVAMANGDGLDELHRPKPAANGRKSRRKGAK